jgi:hypothetical protein
LQFMLTATDPSSTNLIFNNYTARSGHSLADD